MIYQSGLHYYQPFLESLKKQTDKNFQLFLLNQDVQDVKSLTDLIPSSMEYKIVNSPVSKYSALNYQFIINNSRESNFDLLIFGDLDDIFSKFRVERIIDNIGDFNFVFHDMSYIDEKGEPINLPSMYHGLNVEQTMFSGIDNLADYNVIGLSNSAISLKGEPIDFRLADDLIAIDWAIYSTVLLRGGKGRFIPEQLTQYRQHDENLVGVGQYYSKDSILRSLKVKSLHYVYLSKLMGKNETTYRRKIGELQATITYIMKTKSNFKRYLTELKSVIGGRTVYWWHNSLTINQLGLMNSSN